MMLRYELRVGELRSRELENKMVAQGYTAPPNWQPLTEDEKAELAELRRRIAGAKADKDGTP